MRVQVIEHGSVLFEGSATQQGGDHRTLRGARS